MIKEYFKSLEDGLSAKILANPGRPNARKKFALEIARLGKRLFSEGETIAWCGVAAPFDLLNAMGINSCFVEFIGAMLSSMAQSTSFWTRPNWSDITRTAAHIIARSSAPRCST